MNSRAHRAVLELTDPEPVEADVDASAKSTKKKARRKAKPAAETEMGVPGTRVPRGYALATRGFYDPRKRGTEVPTSDAEILTGAVVAQPTDMNGIALGRDMLTRSLVAHDPITAYEQKELESPAVAVIGEIGVGKSSLIKTAYVLRPLMFEKRRAVVIDKKERGGEGEYAELTRTFGEEPIKMSTRGDGSVLNPMDPMITNPAEIEDRMSGARAIRAIAEIAGERTLDEWEDGALRAAYVKTLDLYDGKKRPPVLTDLIKHLGSADLLSGSASKLPAAKERFVMAGASVAFMLERLLQAYPGVFDGQTSKSVNLASKLTTFDVSQLTSTGPAIDAVIALANTWLVGQLRSGENWRTNFVVEEGWHVLRGANAPLIEENTKLARAFGLSMVTAIHHPSDIPEGTPGREILRQAKTVHLYRQSRENDIALIAKMFDLEQNSAELLRTLPPGEHLLKIGQNPEMRVEHIRSDLETMLTNTDDAMLVNKER